MIVLTTLYHVGTIVFRYSALKDFILIQLQLAGFLQLQRSGYHIDRRLVWTAIIFGNGLGCPNFLWRFWTWTFSLIIRRNRVSRVNHLLSSVGSWLPYSMVISGTDQLEVPTIYLIYIRPEITIDICLNSWNKHPSWFFTFFQVFSIISGIIYTWGYHWQDIFLTWGLATHRIDSPRSPKILLYYPLVV